MGTNNDQAAFLLMQDHEDYVLNHFGTEPRTILYLRADQSKDSRGFFCALIPLEKANDCLRRAEWDLMVGNGRPSFAISQACDGTQTIKYSRTGHNRGVEPIIHVRGTRPDTIVELIEEFRLLYSLFPDSNGRLFRWNEAGNKDFVANISPEKADIDTRLLRQFLAAKQMALIGFFHHTRGSNVDISLIPESQRKKETKTDCVMLHFWLTDMNEVDPSGDEKTAATFLGKKLIYPLDIHDCDIWPYSEKEKSYIDFIVGITSEGKTINSTSNPNELNDIFENNPGAHQYLTPICFRREVLTKYYQNPSKYSIEDGLLRCGHTWSISIDNNHEHYIFAYLGDLGRDLPEVEQLYWKSFNIPPDGTISHTSYARNMLAEPTDASALDLALKHRLAQLENAWTEKFGWALFQDFENTDAHFSNSLHIPLISDQSQFDQQLLNLSKSLIDRLSVKAIEKTLSQKPKDKGSINALEQFLLEKGFSSAQSKLPILRDIQGLRSTGVAHLKGSKYAQLAESLDIRQDNLIEVFRSLLQRCISFIIELEKAALLYTPAS